MDHTAIEIAAGEDPCVRLRSCSCCGLVQRVPPLATGRRACCARCRSHLMHGPGHRSPSRTAALATAALILYPLAMTLPVMGVQQFGHRNQTSILEGTATLLGSGHLVIGLIVLLCSVILPLTKLLALLVLSSGGGFLHHRHRAFTYHLVEWTGRWGMLDVLLVAVVVAAIKLGDMVSVSAGPGAIAFASCVILSLLAGASFDPHRLWEDPS
jgi:paraquat-inducible protein A